MKKIYSTPNVMVIKIGTVQMLADSLDKRSDTPLVDPSSPNVLGREAELDFDDEY